MRARPAIAAVLAVVLLGACAQEDTRVLPTTTTTTTTVPDPGTTTPGGTTPEAEGPPPFVPAPIEWRDCGRRTQCATVTVPLDHDDPGGPTFDLDVARDPADDGGRRIGALFVNPGGPGASATDLVPTVAAVLPDSITDRFDVVGVDPRGVGASERLDCGLPNAELYGVDATIDSAADEVALLDVSRRYVADCQQRAGDLLAHLGTRDVARDMDAVRAAMGDEQLNYLGFSYGTAIGQVYADLFPDRVRAMVLDGVLELGPTGLELADEQARGFTTALDRFVAWCDSSSRCAAGPRSRALLDEVLAAAERPGGIPAPGANRDAGPGEVSLGLTYPMYSQLLWTALGDALVEAAEGDGSRMVDLADGYLGMGGFSVYFAVNCLDFAWPDDPAAVLAAAKDTGTRSPVVGEALVNDYVRCALWPVEPEPLPATSAPGTPPILVVSTTGDPATPYEAGVAVAERLESGVLVTHEGDGHTVVLDGNGCITDLVVDYLVDLVAPPDGTTCD
ncbi:MAG: alpha/beta hydrolase [Acidimicrobiia bacterium]